MADESSRRERRALPVLDDAQVVTPSRYTPVVLTNIALHEAAVLAPVVTRSVSGAIEAAAIASARTEQLVTEALQDEPPAQSIACAPGCSTCCQAKVLVLAPEVLRVGAHLRQTKTTDEIVVLLERVRQADAITRGLSRAQRAEAHVFCPLLDEAGACSIHEVRPLVCRSWTSYEAQACADYWRAPSGRRTPPQWAAGYELAQAMMAGLGKACLDRGLDGLPLEFISALRIVLERPNAGERWLERLPVFMTARDREWAEANKRV